MSGPEEAEAKPYYEGQTDETLNGGGRGHGQFTHRTWPRAAIVGAAEASYQIDPGHSGAPNRRWFQSGPGQNVGIHVASPEPKFRQRLISYTHDACARGHTSMYRQRLAN